MGSMEEGVKLSPTLPLQQTFLLLSGSLSTAHAYLPQRSDHPPHIQHLIHTVTQVAFLQCNFHSISHPQSLSKRHLTFVSHMNIF